MKGFTGAVKPGGGLALGQNTVFAGKAAPGLVRAGHERSGGHIIPQGVAGDCVQINVIPHHQPEGGLIVGIEMVDDHIGRKGEIPVSRDWLIIHGNPVCRGGNFSHSCAHNGAVISLKASGSHPDSLLVGGKAEINVIQIFVGINIPEHSALPVSNRGPLGALLVRPVKNALLIERVHCENGGIRRSHILGKVIFERAGALDQLIGNQPCIAGGAVKVGVSIVNAGIPKRASGMAVLDALCSQLCIDFPGPFGQIQNRHAFGNTGPIDGFGVIASLKDSFNSALRTGDMAACSGIVVSCIPAHNGSA